MQNTDPTEEFRRRLLAAVRSYDYKLNAEIDVYRSQRAWRLMLVCRKAYGLAFHGGWRGPLRLMGWAIKGLCGGSLDLETEELPFPSLASYLPDELFYPFQGDSAWRGRGAGWDTVERRYDVLIFPVFNFDFRFQRPQQIAAELARRGHRVFWVSPSRVVLEEGKAYETAPLRENLWELHLRMRPQDLYQGTLADDALSGMMASLGAFYRDFAVGASCAVVQFPYWRRCALGLRDRFGAAVVYDCMDDWQNWSAEPSISAFSLAEERKLARECDVLAVTASEFETRYRSEGLSPVVVKNAADFRFFGAGEPQGFLAKIPRPVVGYYGAIADWFDLETVEELARMRPNYSFVLMGHNYRKDIGRLRRLPNVHLLGEKDYRELPSYLREFDVCLIPFAMSALIKAVDPVKAYEYLSQGKPVVAAPLPELTHLGELVYFANGPGEFAKQVDAALGESGSGLREKRVEFAAQNTWARRVDDLTERIKARYPLVSILMVTYNCREFLRPCLDSIRRNTAYPNYEVIAVDNNSTDGTQAVLREYAAAEPRLQLELLEENRGFAAGNNEAARLSRGEYLLLLNPDTILTFGWLHRLLRLFHNQPETGLASPVTNFSGNQTKINFHYSDVETMEEFAWSLAARQMGETTEIPMAPLFCTLVRRELWNSLGGLDESFRVGMFEDDDFSLRVCQAGLKVMAVEDCFVHHFGGGSFGKIPSGDSLRIFEENRRRFEEKWGRPWTEHRLRPGVKSIREDRRFSPGDFAGKGGIRESLPAPVLRELSPAFTTAGKAFNVQPGGDSALAVRCMFAMPGTVVVFGGQPLGTVYGGTDCVTALVPVEMLAGKGGHKVWLRNDYGESNQVEFMIR